MIRPIKALVVSSFSALMLFLVSWSVTFSERIMLRTTLTTLTMAPELILKDNLPPPLQEAAKQPPKPQQQQQTQHDVIGEIPLDNPHLLTIAVDNRGSCPDLCTWVHTLLPSWVRYRYIDFHTEVDLAARIATDEATAPRAYSHHHIMIVARTNIINLANWAVERRQNHNTTQPHHKQPLSIGLWHNADERVYFGEIKNVYHKFDYVIRNYFQAHPDDGTLWGFPFHALGNYSCGSHRQVLPDYNPSVPTWGVHYAMLEAHTMHVLTQRHGTSVWPTHLRPTNCSFMGNVDTKRSHHQRTAMREAVETVAADLHCQVDFSTGFARGHSKFVYFNTDLAQTKIGMAPRGSTDETHRLTELLQMGTVPAVVSSPYLYAPFRNIPAIIGDNWTHTAALMLEYVRDKPLELQALSLDGSLFYRELHACMTADIDFILRGCFAK